MKDALALYRLGRVDYEAALSWQAEASSAVRRGGEERLALLEHPPVYSFGRRVRREHLLVAPERLRARGAQIVESDRGGDVTFHGPGQIVGYPVLELSRHGLGPREYVRALEETLVRALRGFRVPATRVEGRPGVWAGGAKVAAIGVRLSGGVTTHGFALNVTTDLSWFDAIVPCGLHDAGVTSLERLLAFDPGIGAVEDALVEAFEDVFGVALVGVSGLVRREATLLGG